MVTKNYGCKRCNLTGWSSQGEKCKCVPAGTNPDPPAGKKRPAAPPSPPPAHGMNQPTAAMTNSAIQRRIQFLLEEHLAAVDAADWFTADVCYGGILTLGKLAGDLEFTGASAAASQALQQTKPYPRHNAA